MKILRTVIGSFPPRKASLEDAIRWAVDVQLRHGIDIVSDGEQRGDMISYFSSLPGLGVKPQGPYVESRILPLNDLKGFAKLKDLHFVRDCLRAIGREEVQVKVSVTGPITLGFACAVNGLNYYRNLADAKLYSDFAQALNPLIVEVAKTGCYLQVDEPSLSIGVMNSKDAVKLVNESLSGLPETLYEEEKLAIHVCGPLTETLFNDFMKLEAPVLSLAFSAPNVSTNLRVIDRQVLQCAGKKVGVGCVSVQVARASEMEGLEAVIGRLKRIRDKIGNETIVYIHPDCGMRNTGGDAVEPILNVLESSAKFLEQDV